MNYVHPAIVVAHTTGKGRGVFTSEALAAGTLIEVAPVIVMPGKDRKLLDQTLLHDYIFEWGVRRTRCAMALGYVPLYNHAYKSNCEYEMDFDAAIISVRTVMAVPARSELLINYNGDWDNEKPVWFAAK